MYVFTVNENIDISRVPGYRNKTLCRNLIEVNQTYTAIKNHYDILSEKQNIFGVEVIVVEDKLELGIEHMRNYLRYRSV